MVIGNKTGCFVCLMFSTEMRSLSLYYQPIDNKSFYHRLDPNVSPNDYLVS